MFACQTSLPKVFFIFKKGKGGKTKGDAKDVDAIRGTIKLGMGDKPKK
jgi:hypothetical protein